MPSAITFRHDRQGRMGWTTRLVESFLEQLSSHQLFMDVDIIPEVWISRETARREHWEEGLIAEPSSKYTAASRLQHQQVQASIGGDGVWCNDTATMPNERTSP